MTHARIPDFSILPATLAVSTRILSSDPVLEAIDAHAEAWAVFQIADAGRPSEATEDAMSVALEDLLATPCSSHFGALALIRHLRWLIREEAITADADDVLGRLVLVREADLSRFAGSDLPPDLLPVASPLGRFAPPVVPGLPPALTAPQGDPILRRVLRASGLAGEIFATIAIIGGGAVLTGLATLL
ncbi:hypothetical protein SAMN05216360_1257 [Methylobacterium phyllostachyos]|uniref:Uncharacterized protein n=1 Tax=Methylobacterium phyllostachyos TaxID=582672 RepID=A0A1H0K4Y0_9HYPH|nr:hypothetical protein [Methylobacterium phyllostachyos]SDO51158.1 hypothetical protein SAMN05216360_1257 [Methylobacterium phyllostachyos]